MAKVTLTNLTSLTSNEASAVSTINANNDAVEAAIENTLSRDGTSPNTMNADIDMNSNDLLNVGEVATTALRLNGQLVTDLANANAYWGDIIGTITDQTDLVNYIATNTGAAASATKSASFTFALGEQNKTIVADSASAIEATIPTNASVAFPLGSKLRLYRKNTGTVKFVPDSGVTLRLPTGIKPKALIGAWAVGASGTLNITTDQGLPFAGTDVYDTNNFHDPVTNNKRMTIPSGLGIKKVSLNGAARYLNDTADRWRVTYFMQYNSAGTLLNAYNFMAFESGVGSFEVVNFLQNVQVSDGDYFEYWVRTEFDTAIDWDRSNFIIEVTEIDAQGFVAFQYGAVEIEKIGTNEWIVTDHSALG